MGDHSLPQPSQTRFPVRTMFRSAIQLIPGIALMVPAVITEAGIDSTTGWAAAAVGTSLTITRIMALPAVNDFLARWLPPLAAEPKT